MFSLHLQPPHPELPAHFQHHLDRCGLGSEPDSSQLEAQRDITNIPGYWFTFDEVAPVTLVSWLYWVAKPEICFALVPLIYNIVNLTVKNLSIQAFSWSTALIFLHLIFMLFTFYFILDSKILHTLKYQSTYKCYIKICTKRWFYSPGCFPLKMLHNQLLEIFYLDDWASRHLLAALW